MNAEHKSTLSDLLQEQNALIEALVATEGELTPEMQKLADHVEIALPAKVDGYFMILKRLESDAEYFEARSVEFSNAAHVLWAAKERLKENLRYNMSQQGLKEVLGNEYRFTLSPSKPKLSTQDDIIPKEYMRETIVSTIDKEKIRDDLLLGVPVPGAQLVPVFSLRPSINKKPKQIKIPGGNLPNYNWESVGPGGCDSHCIEHPCGRCYNDNVRSGVLKGPILSPPKGKS